MAAPSRHHARLASAALVIAALSLVGCANDPAPAAPVEAQSAEPATTPLEPSEPTPEADPAAVLGERVPAAHWVNSSSLLSHREAVTGSGDTVLTFLHAVGDWLDAHLTDLQAGGDGLLADVAPASLLEHATAADTSLVTDALASPAAPVASARYLLEGSYDATAEWLEATVEVTHQDGTVARATMVFVPGDDGPQLVLFGPVTAGGDA